MSNQTNFKGIKMETITENLIIATQREMYDLKRISSLADKPEDNDILILWEFTDRFSITNKRADNWVPLTEMYLNQDEAIQIVNFKIQQGFNCSYDVIEFNRQILIGGKISGLTCFNNCTIIKKDCR